MKFLLFITLNALFMRVFGYSGSKIPSQAGPFGLTGGATGASGNDITESSESSLDSLGQCPVSEDRCGDFGLDASGGVSPDICAFVLMENGACSAPADHTVAEGNCEDLGARLCTLRELLENEAGDPEKSHHLDANDFNCVIEPNTESSSLVWTSTKCERTENTGLSQFWTVSASTTNGQAPVCALATELSKTVCCVDGLGGGDSLSSSSDSSSDDSEDSDDFESPICGGCECSEHTCEEYGYEFDNQDRNDRISLGSPTVCGDNNLGISFGEIEERICSDNLSHSEAVEYCRNGPGDGRRLCTIEEMLIDDVRFSGCNVARQYSWTSTACGPNKDFFWMVITKADFDYELQPPKCVDPNSADSIARVPCCADVDLSTACGGTCQD